MPQYICPSCGGYTGHKPESGEELGWVKCSERLPEDAGMKIIFAASADPAKPLIMTAWYEPEGTLWNPGWQMINEYWAKHITHWMPLPEPPT